VKRGACSGTHAGGENGSRGAYRLSTVRTAWAGGEKQLIGEREGGGEGGRGGGGGGREKDNGCLGVCVKERGGDGSVCYLRKKFCVVLDANQSRLDAPFLRRLDPDIHTFANEAVVSWDEALGIVSRVGHHVFRVLPILDHPRLLRRPHH
jgi:hypothetical protein